MYKKWLTTRLPKHDEEYKKYKKIFKEVADEAESLYYREKFNSKTNSIKQLWKNLNTVCSFKNRQPKRNGIPKLKVGNVYLTKPEDISNGMNSYFSTVGEKLVKSLFKNGPITHDFRSYCNVEIKESIFVEPVTKNELNRLIKKLVDSKAPGPDNIGPALVKLVAPIITEPILHIYNLSLFNGVVPNKLKVAKVVPIFKKATAVRPVITDLFHC